MANREVCVFEVVNRDAGEVIVGISLDCSLDALAEAHRREPPVWMLSWAPGKAEYRWAATSIPLQDALSFVSTYAHSETLKTFRVHLVG